MNERMQEILNNNFKDLNEAKKHTENKILLVKTYVHKWLFTMVNYDRVHDINFIDCMCNAGIYNNGIIGTPVEVLKEFIEFAKNNSNKIFNLFFNDYNRKRIEILKEICNLYEYYKLPNLKIYFSCNDVNVYLDELTSNNFFANNYCSTILFVDPYNFGTVNTTKIINFTSKFYCELLFNLFVSDINRNAYNKSLPNKPDVIKESITDILYKELPIKSGIVEDSISRSLKQGHYIEYCFSYEFRIKTNVEYYHILFATPSIKGLELFKETLWDLFDGAKHYKYENVAEGQLHLFDDSTLNLEYLSHEAQDLLLDYFIGKTINYEDINVFLLEKTMLKSGQIINNVLKPMINKNLVIKNNIMNNKNNYKNDTYTFDNLEK